MVLVDALHETQYLIKMVDHTGSKTSDSIHSHDSLNQTLQVLNQQKSKQMLIKPWIRGKPTRILSSKSQIKPLGGIDVHYLNQRLQLSKDHNGNGGLGCIFNNYQVETLILH